MNAHKVKAVLAEDGTLILRDLPFHAGDAVEVIILERKVPLEVNPNGIPNYNVSLAEKSFYETATDEEWEAAIADFVNSASFSKTPLLSDQAISRESIYQERDNDQL